MLLSRSDSWSLQVLSSILYRSRLAHGKMALTLLCSRGCNVDVAVLCSGRNGSAQTLGVVQGCRFCSQEGMLTQRGPVAQRSRSSPSAATSVATADAAAAPLGSKKK